MAARRRAPSHRTDRLSAAYRTCSVPTMRPRPTPPSASTMGWSRPATMRACRMRTAASRPRTGTSRSGSRRLALRGSRDFPDLASYQAFLAEFVMRKNARRRTAVETELKVMRPLPRFRTTDFSVATVTVTRSATVSVRGVLYTVPSRLIGSRLKVHIYDDRLVCWLGTTLLLTLPRRHYKRGAPRQRGGRLSASDRCAGAQAAGVPPVDLSRRAVLRPVPARLGSDRRHLEPRKACRVYVGLLHLAAMPARRRSLTISRSFSTAARCRIWRWRAVAPPPTHAPQVGVRAPDLGGYDQLLEGARYERSRCRPAAADADHLAPADHRPALAQLRRAGGQRRLGCRAILAALCEHELAERTTRRIARHLAQSGSPRARRSPPSSSPRSRPSARRMCSLWAPATPGWIRAPMSYCLGQVVPASRTSPPRSAMP